VLFISGTGLTLTAAGLARLTAAHRTELDFDAEPSALSPSGAS